MAPRSNQAQPRRVRLNYESDSVDSRSLEAYVDEKGNLVVEGADSGPKVKDFWKVSGEYEYWRTVKRRHVDRVFTLLQAQAGKNAAADDRLKLMRRFKSEPEFSTWLDENGIPSAFNSWLSGDWD